MTTETLKLAIFATELKRQMIERIKEEKGEIGSWLILAAGLVVAAVFAGGELYTWITDRTGDITSQSSTAG